MRLSRRVNTGARSKSAVAMLANDVTDDGAFAYRQSIVTELAVICVDAHVARLPEATQIKYAAHENTMRSEVNQGLSIGCRIVKVTDEITMKKRVAIGPVAQCALWIATGTRRKINSSTTAEIPRVARLSTAIPVAIQATTVTINATAT